MYKKTKKVPGVDYIKDYTDNAYNFKLQHERMALDYSKANIISRERYF